MVLRGRARRGVATRRSASVSTTSVGARAAREPDPRHPARTVCGKARGRRDRTACCLRSPHHGHCGATGSCRRRREGAPARRRAPRRNVRRRQGESAHPAIARIRREPCLPPRQLLNLRARSSFARPHVAPTVSLDRPQFAHSGSCRPLMRSGAVCGGRRNMNIPATPARAKAARSCASQRECGVAPLPWSQRTGQYDLLRLMSCTRWGASKVWLRASAQNAWKTAWSGIPSSSSPGVRKG